MRKLSFLLLFLSGFAQAQIINFPDAAFKAKLLSAGPLENVAFNNLGVKISIDADLDGQITLQELQPVYQLDVSASGISDLTGIGFFNNLNFLICENNLLTALDVSMLGQLENLYCMSNQLSNLSINDGLLVLKAENNLLASLDLSNHAVPYTAVLLDNNLLTSLTVDSVYWLRVSNNPITTLNLTGAFQTLQVTSTPMTVLDLSHAHIIQNGLLHFNDTPLELLIVKNGYDESTSFSLTDSFNTLVPNLYICADENEIVDFQAQIAAATVDNWMIGSYCSFTPGGAYNTIGGTTRFDYNNNGCDGNDSQSIFVKIMIDDGIETGSVFTNTSGEYHFFTQDGSFTLTPVIENAAWFNFAPPTATISFPSNDSLNATQDFCVTANGIHPDLEVAIAPYVPARPGFDAVYELVYRNKGNQTLSGTIDFNFDDAVLDYVSSNPNADAQSSGLLSYNYSNLHPFENRSVLVTLNVNAPTETPPVNIDDVLVFSTTVNPISGDEWPMDNSFTLNQTVMGSFDPNAKTCLEGEILEPQDIGSYLHYNISFENEGNAPAQNVVIEDVVNTDQFDINSLQIMNSSHPVDVRVNGNKVEFIFENINLPPSSVNPIGGHGNVLFKIKTLPTLSVGNMVTNTANIYFDYNHPIETNEARTTFASLSNTVFDKDDSVGAYPNPANDWIQVKADSIIKTIELYDVQGRILQHTSEYKNDVSVDITDKSNGIYFLKITTDKGSKVIKLVKE